MQKISTFLEGKKTYVGLAVTLIGVFGLSNYISPEETEALVQSLFEIVGVAIAIYGRFAAKPR